MKKRILFLTALILLLAFCLQGCGLLLGVGGFSAGRASCNKQNHFFSSPLPLWEKGAMRRYGDICISSKDRLLR